MDNIMDGHNMKVVSIDAWSNGEDTGWDWNAWYKVGCLLNRRRSHFHIVLVLGDTNVHINC